MDSIVISSKEQEFDSKKKKLKRPAENCTTDVSSKRFKTNDQNQKHVSVQNLVIDSESQKTESTVQKQAHVSKKKLTVNIAGIYANEHNINNKKKRNRNKNGVISKFDMFCNHYSQIGKLNKQKLNNLDEKKNKEIDNMSENYDQSITKQNPGYNFPVEVLEMLFARTNIDDRKHARLVCNHWYNILHRKLNCEEKIVIRKLDDVKALLNGPLLPLQSAIDVHLSSVEAIYVDFWFNHGDQITELRFNQKCIIQDKRKFLVLIIRCCSRLKVLHFNSAENYNLKNYYELEPWRQPFEQEIIDLASEGKYVHKNLVEIKLGYVWQDVGHLLSLFKVFPNVKKLLSRIDFTNEIEKIEWIKLNNFGKQIIKLYITADVETIQEWKWDLPNLEDLEIDAVGWDCPDFADFICDQKNLKRLKIVFADELNGISSWGLKLTNKCLQECLHLTEFSLIYHHGVMTQNEEISEHIKFQTILNTENLKIFSFPLKIMISTAHIRNFSNIMDNDENILMKKHPLRKLRVATPYSEVIVTNWHMMFRYFPHLTHVDVIFTMNTFEMLEALNKYCPNLQALKIGYEKITDDDGRQLFFPYNKISYLNNFEELVSLNISLRTFEFNRKADPINPLNLPKLQYLTITIDGYFDDKMTLHFFTTLNANCPSLKYINMHASAMRIQNEYLMNFAMSAKKLEYIYVYRKLFSINAIDKKTNWHMKCFFKKTSCLKELNVCEWNKNELENEKKNISNLTFVYNRASDTLFRYNETYLTHFNDPWSWL